MNCKICGASLEKIFSKKVLLKYDVDYHQCSNCGFVQTDEAFWLDEAYQSAITSLDIGILVRNSLLLKNIPKIINTCFSEANVFLDYAGGYGLFTRSMRDLGFDFYRQDIYCDNIFAQYFDITDTNFSKFDVVTAFEVFEHLSRPLEEIETILKYSDHLIFSTEIVPDQTYAIENWVYIAHETGQHIAFYSEKSLELIAKKFNKNYYRKNNIHIYTTKTFTTEQIDYALKDQEVKKVFFGLKKKKIKKFNIKRESYQDRDYLKIKEILYKNL
ncbi:class I SAM-dependent methyltransferase [Chryseobacterium sp. SC28]|nr:class I SAM-dependent methyltransferase [Chryseobacterium sp. SC28]